MRPRSRRYARNGLIALALLLLAGWEAPSFFNAERYRHRLEAGLERTLDRHVTFGAVSFRLLPRPGFTIENAMVREDPAFGSEPFARVDRIDCDLRWRSLWQSHWDFSRLYLERPSFNLVRNAQGVWNVEKFLRQTGLASPEKSALGAGGYRGDLDLEADDARIDFKAGADKKPFALTEASARVNFYRQNGLLAFRLAASPIRTDLSLPTPGLVQLDGEWTPGSELEGPIDATLQTRGALLYDWIPLVTGRNPQIYGVLDAQIHLTGSLHFLKIEGQSSVSQLHRWGLPPPADPMPSTLNFRGQFDRTRGRVVIESLDGTFADSRIHFTGSIDKAPSSPELDLVVAVERSRLEDFLALSRRFSGHESAFGISGRVDALMSIQGPWNDRHYGGFVGGRSVLLSTPTGSFPVSEVDVHIEPTGARLAPVRIALAPRVELVVEGAIEPAALAVPARRQASPPRRQTKKTKPRTAEPPNNEGAPRYELSLAAKAAPLHDLVSFARAIGMLSVPGIDARGTASATFTLTGSAWPLDRPMIEGLAVLHAASLLIPGLTEPLNLPRAHIEVAGNRVTADPVVAVLGTSVFTGRLEHQGDRKQPWEFDIRANHLSLEQGSLWFDGLGRRQPVPLLERLPGLGSSDALRVAASNFFGAINTKGEFSCPAVSYHALNLGDFKTSAEISGRLVRLEGATFRAGGGHGQGRLVVDLTSTPARVTLDVAMADGNLPAVAGRLPVALSKVKGTYSGAGHFETRGLSHEEISDNLQGQATVHLKNISLGDFDPLQTLARQKGWGTLERARGEAGVRSSVVTGYVHDRSIQIDNAPVQLTGAKLKVTGVYSFDGVLELNVHADLRRLTRRWLSIEDEGDANARLVDLRLEGTFNKLSIAPQMAASQAAPIHRGR